MKTPTPPTSDAIATLRTAAKRLRLGVEGQITADELEVIADGMESAREIAAQPGEGRDWNAWLSTMADDDWIVLFAHRPDLKSRLQEVFASPPHAADALDGERYRWMVEWIMSEESLPTEQGNAIDAAMDAKDVSAFNAAIDAAISARAEAGETK